MSYTYLLFDLDHTLLDFDRSEALALQAFCQDYGLPYDDTTLSTYRQHNHQLWQALEMGELTKDQLLAQRLPRFFAPRLDHLDGQTLDDQYRDYLITYSQPFDGATALLEDLQQAGYHLIAATNGVADTQRRRLSQAGWLSYFEHLAISEELGYSKPHPSFFQAIFQMTGDLHLEAYLMIGDRLSSDMLGAYNAHIDSLWYHQPDASLPTHPPLTYTAHNFDQIRSLLLP